MYTATHGRHDYVVVLLLVMISLHMLIFRLMVTMVADFAH